MSRERLLESVNEGLRSKSKSMYVASGLRGDGSVGRDVDFVCASKAESETVEKIVFEEFSKVSDLAFSFHRSEGGWRAISIQGLPFRGPGQYFELDCKTGVKWAGKDWAKFLETRVAIIGPFEHSKDGVVVDPRHVIAKRFLIKNARALVRGKAIELEAEYSSYVDQLDASEFSGLFRRLTTDGRFMEPNARVLLQARLILRARMVFALIFGMPGKLLREVRRFFGALKRERRLWLPVLVVKGVSDRDAMDACLAAVQPVCPIPFPRVVVCGSISRRMALMRAPLDWFRAVLAVDRQRLVVFFGWRPFGLSVVDSANCGLVVSSFDVDTVLERWLDAGVCR